MEAISTVPTFQSSEEVGRSSDQNARSTEDTMDDKVSILRRGRAVFRLLDQQTLKRDHPEVSILRRGRAVFRLGLYDNGSFLPEKFQSSEEVGRSSDYFAKVRAPETPLTFQSSEEVGRSSDDNPNGIKGISLQVSILRRGRAVFRQAIGLAHLISNFDVSILRRGRAVFRL